MSMEFPEGMKHLAQECEAQTPKAEGSGPLTGPAWPDVPGVSCLILGGW